MTWSDTQKHRYWWLLGKTLKMTFWVNFERSYHCGTGRRSKQVIACEKCFYPHFNTSWAVSKQFSHIISTLLKLAYGCEMEKHHWCERILHNNLGILIRSKKLLFPEDVFQNLYILIAWITESLRINGHSVYEPADEDTVLNLNVTAIGCSLLKFSKVSERDLPRKLSQAE